VWLPPLASDLTLLSQTAAGDVFVNTLKPRDQFQLTEKTLCCDVDDNSKYQKINANNSSEKRDLSCLINWEQQLLEMKTMSVLKVTSRKEMKPVYKSKTSDYC
jgi:hypothetical protein